MIRPQLKKQIMRPSTISETHLSYKWWHPIPMGCSSFVFCLLCFWQGQALTLLVSWGMQVLALKVCGPKLLVKLALGPVLGLAAAGPALDPACGALLGPALSCPWPGSGPCPGPGHGPSPGAHMETLNYYYTDN